MDRQCSETAHSIAGWCALHAGIEEVAQKGRQQRVGLEEPAEPDSAPGTKEEVLDSEYGAGQDTEPLKPLSTGDCSPSQVLSFLQIERQSTQRPDRH